MEFPLTPDQTDDYLRSVLYATAEASNMNTYQFHVGEHGKTIEMSVRRVYPEGTVYVHLTGLIQVVPNDAANAA